MKELLTTDRAADSRELGGLELGAGRIEEEAKGVGSCPLGPGVVGFIFLAWFYH